MYTEKSSGRKGYSIKPQILRPYCVAFYQDKKGKLALYVT